MAERATVVCAGDAVARAAEILVAALRAADGASGGARLAIPGGSALAVVGPARAQLGPAWGRIRLTWVDERVVPFADARSNRGLAFRSAALDALDPPAVLLPLLTDGEPAHCAVARVDAALAAQFGGALDVALLGMGEDGHIASLFGGAADGSRARVVFVPARAGGSARLSLTRAMLATATRTVLVATGEAKRAALERVVAGDPALPASGLPGLVVVTNLDLRGGSAR
jgi:6-phosphogluconolactonase